MCPEKSEAPPRRRVSTLCRAPAPRRRSPLQQWRSQHPTGGAPPVGSAADRILSALVIEIGSFVFGRVSGTLTNSDRPVQCGAVDRGGFSAQRRTPDGYRAHPSGSTH